MSIPNILLQDLNPNFILKLVDRGWMPAFSTSLEETFNLIELDLAEMMAGILGEIVPQLIGHGLLVPADAHAISQQIEALTQSISELTEQLGQLSNATDSNASDIAALQESLATVLQSIDSTISFLTDLQSQLDQNSDTYADVLRTINDLQRARDVVSALGLMGVLGQ